MSTAAQPVQTAAPPPQGGVFDPVAELRQRYPGVANEPDEKIRQHLSSPENFRAAFPEYAHLDNETITRNLQAKKSAAGPYEAAAQATSISADKRGWMQRLNDWYVRREGTYGGTLGTTARSPREVTGELAQGAMVGSIPAIGAGLVAAPAATLMGLAAGVVGGKVGGTAGRWAGEKVGAPELGEDVGALAGTAAGGYAGSRPAISQAPGKFMRMANKAVVKPIAEGYTIGMPGEAMVKKGLGPYAKQTGFDAGLRNARDAVLDYHRETPIKSIADLKEALPEIEKKVTNERMNPVALRHANETMAPERFQRAQQAVREAVGPHMQEFDPEASKEILGSDDSKTGKHTDGLVDKIGKARTVGELIGTTAGERGGLLGYINAKLNSYFAKYPSARATDLMTNPDTAAWEAARRSLREEVLGHLEDQGEADIRDARQTFGGLKELEKAVERRVNVNDRAKPMSLPRILGLVSAGPTGGFGLVAGEVAHWMNKPDVLVGRGINRMAKAASREVPAITTEAGETPPQLPPQAASRMMKAAQAEYKPSEKAATMSAPRKIVPEQEAQNWQEEINRNEEILRNPRATAEERQIASDRLRDAKEGAAKVTGQGAPAVRLAPEAEEEAQPAEVKGVTEPVKPKAPPREKPVAIEKKYNADEITEAEGLIQQEIGMMQSSDRPGRYFDESTAEEHALKENPAEGVRHGGMWRSVKSIRPQMPFLRENPEFNPAQLEKALRNKDSAIYRRAIERAVEFIRREKGHPGMSETVSRWMKTMREPGEDEGEGVPF